MKIIGMEPISATRDESEVAADEDRSARAALLRTKHYLLALKTTKENLTAHASFTESRP